VLKKVTVLLALCFALLILSPCLPARAQSADTTVTLIGLSDYHSHAVPFYSEGAGDQAGVSRTIAYLKTQRKSNPNLLVLSGGDTMNKGTPTWSDEYKCAEWPWFNGLIDAMAMGNHDFDYGQADFQRCAASATYPVLSANYVDVDGFPLLNTGGKPYFVKTINGVKIGAFAMAGEDFSKLVKRSDMAASSYFADRVKTAQNIVAALRGQEKVDFVVLFGHALVEDDTRIAQAVPGIDLVLGTHSHFKGEWAKIANSNTYIISPFQYLTYLSQVSVTFDSSHKVSAIDGKLVKMDSTIPQDADYAAQVAKMQKDLEAKYPDRFQVLGKSAVEMSVDGVNVNETVLGNWSMEVVRASAASHAFFSTSSSFRATLPPGPITVEGFFTAIPYKNSIVTADLSGQQLTDLLNLSVSKRNSDSFLQESGVRFKMTDGKATDIQVLKNPSNPLAGYEPLDLSKTYRVGATNFMTNVAAGYRELFAQGANLTDSKVDIGNLLTTTIQTQGTISATLDGRMGVAAVAQAQPTAMVSGTMQAQPTAMMQPTMMAEPTMIMTGTMMAAPTAMMQPTAMMPGLPRTGSTPADFAWGWLLLVAGSLMLVGFGSRRLVRR